MAGQFPFRVSPSGPFSQTTDDAALGGVGFKRYVVNAAPAVIDASPTTVNVDLTFSEPIQAQPGQATIFEVELAAYGIGIGTGGADATLVMGVSGLVTGTGAESSEVVQTYPVPVGLEGPVTFPRSCFFQCDAETETVTGLRLRLTSANFDAKSISFSAGNLEAVVTRVQ